MTERTPVVQTPFLTTLLHIDLILGLFLPCSLAPHEPQMQGSVNGKYDSLLQMAMCWETAKFAPKRIALLAIKNDNSCNGAGENKF